MSRHFALSRSFVLAVFTWVLDYWGSQEMRIFSDEDLSYEELSRFNKVAILNHRGDIDWMLGIALCDRLGILQVCNCMKACKMAIVCCHGSGSLSFSC